MNGRSLPPAASPRRFGPLVIIVILLALLLGGKFLASTLLDYEWWKEVHQLDTWFSQLLYGTLPVLATGVLLFLCFAVAWRLGMQRGSARESRSGGIIARLMLLALLLGALLLAAILIDSWKVVLFFGGLRIPGAGGAYTDPIFGRPLRFYFFYLPFFEILLRILLSASLVSLIIYWLAAHFEDLRQSFARASTGGYGFEFDRLSFGGAFDSAFVRLAIAVLLIALGIHFYLARYELLFEDHGIYLLGVDYVADHIVLPLQWLMIVAAFIGAVLVLIRKGKVALLLLLVLPVRYLAPAIVSSIYVRPNELALEKPYITHHIQATRSAYGLVDRLTETNLDAKAQIPIDYAKHKPLLENVRLWDWRAFHDTVSQIQPLRPYAYFDTDVDRYTLAGSMEQVLLTPRELDIQQLGDARSRWINPHLIYTHGYGVVMAGANKITPDGLPQLLIEDAPPKINSPDLKLTRPQLYYGEIDQEPVYVSTSQPEFDYPSDTNLGDNHYQGTGGFGISPLVRLAAAVRYGDLNVLLTNYLTSASRMMIHRRILDRLSTEAGFLSWDSDPYLVVTEDGRLVWIIDGYMSSESHPYSRALDIQGIGAVNYLRNSVKATVDAYSGETHLYVFDPADPLIQAYQQLFPHLLEPASRMPSDIRAHVRYPETLFAAQAEIYRAFHMRDPQEFYNRADLWDIAKTLTGSGGDGGASVRPTYVVATLPGEDKLEFLLIIPFTPANKDNLIGMMVARCDGNHLGELVFQQLNKQNIIYGPKQIEAFINQDQTISKDLTLWGQQGSEVLRGQVLVLPIENSFLYVEPIYIQASGARMPQLKKVALAMGDHLVYQDTYQQALAQLISENATAGQETNAVPAAPSTVTSSASAAPSNVQQPNPAQAQEERLLMQVRDHFNRYRELNSQGKYSEAGKELEVIQNLLQQKR